MLTVISPAKKLLDFDAPYLDKTSVPVFKQQTNALIQVMKSHTASDIAALMHLSDNLAELNYQRYQAYHTDECPLTACYPALLLFQGDVYQGLDAASLDDDGLNFAQQHLSILSGLYGLLRALDLIQAYRLEMGTKLSNPQGKNLYDFWGASIAREIDHRLEGHHSHVLVNLASNEYFKAVDSKTLKATVINIHFKENKNGQLKTIGIHAKKARGLMARYIIDNRIDAPDGLKGFDGKGYGFDKKLSDETSFFFTRNI